MKRGGFTVMELLVTAAVIAMITALLVPGLRKAREYARTTACCAKVKQLTAAMFLYATENETFPCGFDDLRLDQPPGGYSGNHAYDRMGWWWFDYLNPYLVGIGTTKSVLACPASRVKKNIFKDNILAAHYGVNLSVCRRMTGPASRAEFVGIPLAIPDGRFCSETLLLLDSGYSVISWWNATETPPRPQLPNREDTGYIPGLSVNKHRKLWSGCESDATDGRHPGKTINAGFVDGHIARIKANKLVVEKKTDVYENVFPRWRPE